MAKSEGLVTATEHIRENVRAMRRFAEGSADEVEFHRGRIKNGKNFVGLSEEEQWFFAPSKFAGYQGNGIDHMDRLDDRDGGLTNKRVSELCGDPLRPGDAGYASIDAEYLRYCQLHGIQPSRHRTPRRYWLV